MANINRRAIWRRIRNVLLLTLVLLLAALGAGYSFIRFTGYIIYSSNGCDRFNIDNIELRTETDIPAIDSCQCRYDQTTKTKKAIFYLDRSQVKLPHYIARNEFGPLPQGADSFAYHFEGIGESPLIKPGDAPLLYRHGRHRDGSWEALLQPATGKLWVEVQFNGK